MDNSNKAIAKRINKELKARDWKQTELIRRIIKFKKPNISKEELYLEANTKKGNYSTALKGNNDRSISKDDLYIISKIFGVPLEYIWFGDEKKSGFIPKGARYAAYQDSDDEYRTYIADLGHEDKIQYPDELGFNLFDYFGQFDSINGYKFFVKHYNLHFDYTQYGRLMYDNTEGYQQFCSLSDENSLIISNNLISTLAEYKDVKTFRTIYFDNCSLGRFNPEHMYRDKTFFGERFLEILLQNESFLELVLKTKVVDLNNFNKRYYDKGEKRTFVEPMFFEALSYAMDHEKEYSVQLEKMLNFALNYNKSQYEFVKDYLNANKESEYADVLIDRYSPRFLRSIRNKIMGNIIKINKTSSNDALNELLKNIEQYAFNMTHIINDQEKNNEEIKISTPDNPLFLELHENAIKQRADYIPTISYRDDKFTYFQYFDSKEISSNNLDQLKLIIDVLNKSQTLVKLEDDKVLVHGNINGRVIMFMNGEPVGLAGWQKCHYGDKYEDRAELLANIDTYRYDDQYLEEYEKIFEIISQGFNKEEKIILLDKAINILNNNIEKMLMDGKKETSRAFRIKEQSSKLEFFKEIYLRK